MADVDRIERILNEYDRKVELYSRFCESVEHLLKDLLHTSDIRINAVASRPKERDSFEQKIKSNPKYVSLETVTDVAGARVITYFEDDVDRVDGIIRGEFEIDPLNSVNKRRSLQADRFGYQSLHLVASLNNQRASLRENHEFAGLKIEIQVRSVLQHAWAEIEHGLGYKGESAVPVLIKRRFNRLAGLLELADQEFVAVRAEVGQLSQDLPACRSEGLTELVEFHIDLQYGAIPALSDPVNAELVLWVNTNITGRLIASSSLTEVEMHAEEGVSHAGIKRGAQISASSLAFSDVFPMGPPQKGDFIRLRFSGLRVNAFQLGTSTESAPTVVKAGISIRQKKDDAYSFVRLTDAVDVAVIRPSVRFSTAVPGPRNVLAPRANASEGVKEIFFWVYCSVPFAGAFLPADKERSRSEMSTAGGRVCSFALIGSQLALEYSWRSASRSKGAKHVFD
jgi:ppGpp synthetase/RelA/SpoT-type nucleotidyltranferase